MFTIQAVMNIFLGRFFAYTKLTDTIFFFLSYKEIQESFSILPLPLNSVLKPLGGAEQGGGKLWWLWVVCQSPGGVRRVSDGGDSPAQDF